MKDKTRSFSSVFNKMTFTRSLILGFFAIGSIFVQQADRIIGFLDVGDRNLEGYWKYCQIEKFSGKNLPDLSHCDFESTRLGDSLSKSLPRDQSTGWYVFQKEILVPDSCLNQVQNCHFFFSHGSTYTQAFLDETSIGSYGKFPPDFVFRDLAPMTFEFDGSTQTNRAKLTLISFFPGKQVFGLYLSPAVILSQQGLILSELVHFSQIVFLPILSASILLIIVLFCLIYLSQTKSVEKNVRVFLIYCLFSILYLLSLSRIPTNFLDVSKYMSLNIFLRVGMDLSQFSFLVLLFNIRTRMIFGLKVFFYIVLATLVSLALISFVEPRLLPYSHISVYVMMILSPVLFLKYLVPVLYFKKWQNRFKEKPLLILIILCGVFEFLDVLTFVGFSEFKYTVRFYPALFAIGFAYYIFLSEFQRRKELEVDAERGLIHTQMLHDLKSPLALLKVSESNLRKDSNQNRDLVSKAIRRVEEILKK